MAKFDQLRCISDDGDISAQSFLAATGPLAGAEFLAYSCFREGQTPFFTRALIILSYILYKL